MIIIQHRLQLVALGRLNIVDQVDQAIDFRCDGSVHQPFALS